MLSADEIAEVKRKRSNAKGSLTRLKKNFVEKINQTTTATAINVRLEMLEKYYREFIEADELLSAKSSIQSEIDGFEESYYNVKETLLVALEKTSNPAMQSVQRQLDDTIHRFADQQQSYFDTLNQSHTAVSNIQLQKLSIPPYDGENYTEFGPFKDLYEAAIHNNSSLSNAHKFQYLRGLLRGKASDYIKFIPITDANYESTWTKVKARYDKKKHIITGFIKTFLDQPTMNGQSGHNLRDIANNCDEVIRGLSALGEEAEGRDPWLIHIILSKIDVESKRAWAEATVSKDFPTFAEFIKFLNTRCDALETVEETNKPSCSKKSFKNVKALHTSTEKPKHNYTSTKSNCVLCEMEHRLFDCKKFNDMQSDQRREIAKSKGLCYNCLGRNHSIYSCKSRFRCTICKGRHNTLLHQHSTTSATQPMNDKDSSGVKEIEPSNNTAKSCNSILCSNVNDPILPTAIANVRDVWGFDQKCRILLDSGSIVSLMSEKCAKRLGMKNSCVDLVISGVGEMQTRCQGKSTLNISSLYNDECLNINAYIIPKLSKPVPTNFLKKDAWELSNLQLADNNFNIPAPIDILVGIKHFFEILQDGRKFLNNEGVVAQNTMFGWIIAGGGTDNFEDISSTYLASTTLEANLQRFWELEQLPQCSKFTPEEIYCENHYIENTTRNSDGRFTVRLPFNDDIGELKSTFHQAARRFNLTEQKFERSPELKSHYTKFMQEYADLGHMIECEDTDTNKGYFLPHHPVYKTENGLKKIRVVFDASCKDASGRSLNDCLNTGPTIQSTLWSLLLKFRFHKIALVADIEKMYRQVLVHPDDQIYQKIVWRNSQKEFLKCFKLVTVTYGTSSAPFLATRTLHRLADDEKHSHPKAAKCLKNDFYVDDLLSGAATVQEAIDLKKELQTLISKGGMVLRKWSSNVPELCEEKSSQAVIDLDDASSIKVLGLQWRSEDDSFSFKVVDINNEKVPTKRTLLSEASRTFDPMGWLAPSTLIVKLQFQMLWLRKIDWDEDLPADILKVWQLYKNELKAIEQIQIPRYLGNISATSELHGFCDASESAYGAVVYARTLDSEGKITIRLLTAKSKVAPVKQVSLPRLELCGAHLLAKLMITVHKEFLPQTQFFAWTDSSVVLSWLSDYPRKWKTFVANRVSYIQEKISRNNWNYIKSAENPADVVSRGLSPEKLNECNLWWHGPSWLVQERELWPKNVTEEEIQAKEVEIRKEIKPTKPNTFLVSTEEHTIQRLIIRISSWNKILKTVCIIQRFLNNCQHKIEDRQFGDFSSVELWRSEVVILKYAQSNSFKDDLDALKNSIDHDQKSTQEENSNMSNNRSMKKKLNTNQLAPFIDGDGLLRVGGRIENAAVSFDVKHPIILHSNHPICKMIASHFHIKNLHPGPSLLFHLINQKYWVIGGRNLMRSIVHRCLLCCRYRARLGKQLMGNLPEERVVPAKAFDKVGIDYAGPLMTLNRRGRGSKCIKSYIAIFVCLVTKGIHIEAVSDLSSEAFLGAFRRFCSRRGQPSIVMSDNGTTFVGANRKIDEIIELWSSQEFRGDIAKFCQFEKIEWKFIPPRAPHMGGIWESAVKSVKNHLIKIIGREHLTFEELSTLLCQIESILNSRPLYANIANDNEGYDVLTPAHFLIQTKSIVLPAMSEDDKSIDKRWQLIQKIMQTFWKKFQDEYIHGLQQRKKWKDKSENFKEGDIVLIKSEDLPASHWPMGKIIAVHPGADNLVRVVTIKTPNNTSIQRPIVKLCKLPLN